MPKNVMISGLTASGKTTHSTLTASERGWEYVSASRFLMSRMGVDEIEIPKDFWIGKTGNSVSEKRMADSSIDLWVDQKLVATSIDQEKTVFDSVGLPWLSSEPALRVWLASSIESRCWKSMVSLGSDLRHSYDELIVELKKKDEFTREHFLNYGFDLFHDHKVFDYKIYLTTFISASTSKASQVSIAITQEIISSVVDYYDIPNNQNLSKVKRIIKFHGRDIFLKIPDDIEQIL